MADNLQEQLYQNLRSALLAGQFQPGERLKIRDLAAAWGTSPMPVRAALQRLVAEGALEGEQQRSVRVPAMTRERFQQLFQVRLSLEGLAAEEGARCLSTSEQDVLRDCVAEMERALEQRDVQGYLAHNSQFHLTLYKACANPVLLRLIESLWLQVGPFFNRLFTEADLSLRLNDFHEDCLAAIERGEPSGVRAAIEADLSYFGQFLLNLLDLEGGFAPPSRSRARGALSFPARRHGTSATPNPSYHR